MRSCNATFSTRKLIVTEFDSLGCSESMMHKVYGDSVKSIGKLVSAIRSRRMLQAQGLEEEVEEEEGEEEGEGKPPHEQRIPRAYSWKEVIRQWDEGDPDNGLHVPLSQWSEAMRQIHNRTFTDRKLIAKEFELHGRSEDRMQQIYGASLGGGTVTLLNAIRKRHRLLQLEENSTIRPQIVEDSEEESRAEEEEEEEEVPYVSLPKVPRIRSWKQAVEQWEEGNPEQGLMPIRDWPVEWQKSSRTKLLYLVRKRIAEEFVSCGRDESQMRKLHGAALDNSTQLVLSIRRRLGLSRPRRAKVGTLMSAMSEKEEEEDELEEAEEEEEEEEALTKKRKVINIETSQTSSKKSRS